jgi:hypothetical protein
MQGARCLFYANEFRVINRYTVTSFDESHSSLMIQQ